MQPNPPWPFDIEEVTKAIAEHGSTNPNNCRRSTILRVARLNVAIITSERADEAAYRRPIELLQSDARVLKTLIDNLQQLTLLRIHRGCLYSREVKELGIDIAGVDIL
jgi:hypothetical protein